VNRKISEDIPKTRTPATPLPTTKGTRTSRETSTKRVGKGIMRTGKASQGNKQ
jgi:hypothetical protein